MGNSTSNNSNVTKNKNNPNKPHSLQDFQINLKSFINNNKNENFKSPPEVILPLGIKSCIEEKSNISHHLNSPSSIDLCGDILSLFSNQEIGKVNNGNFYNTILLINIFEENKDNLNSVSSPKMTSITENFTFNIIDKINEVFKINNDLYSSEKFNRYKFSGMHLNSAVKDLLNLNLLQEKLEKHEKHEKANFNISMVSDNCNLNEVNSPVTCLNTKKFSRIETLLSNKSANAKEIEENQNIQNIQNFHTNSIQPMATKNSLNPAKSTSIQSNSILNLGTITSNSNNEQLQKHKKTLKSINELEMELPDKEIKIAFSPVRSPDESISFDKCISPKQKSILKFNKRKGTGVTAKSENIAKISKRLKYSKSIRQQLLDSVKKIKDDKKFLIQNNQNETDSTLTPFDLFSSDMLEQFKEEDKKREEEKKDKINANWLKNIKGKKNNEKKNKNKKTELHFSINLKVIIKKEVEESLNFNKHNSNEKKKKTKAFVSNNSEEFRDCVEKFINMENSINTCTTSYYHNRNNSSKLFRNQPYQNSLKINANTNKSLFNNQESSKKNESQNLIFANSSNINHSNKSLTIISNLEGNITQFKEEQEEASHYYSINEETLEAPNYSNIEKDL